MSKLARLFRTTEEEPTPVPATLSGEWPPWLEGSLMRVGPGVFDLCGFSMNHWCDGYSTLSKFTIRPGQVSFSKKYLRSEAFEKAWKTGRPVVTEFGTKAYPDPTKGFFARAVSNLLPDVTDNCSGNIVKLGNSYFATTDTANLRVIYPDDLSTGEKVDLFKLLGVHVVCSHTVRDRDGVSYALATSLVTGLKYNLLAVPPSSHRTLQAVKDARVVCSIPSRWTTCVSYYHSFGITRRHVVFVEQPYIMNGVKLLSSQFKGKSMKDCLEWIPQQTNRFYVIEKATGRVSRVKYLSREPFFLFHHINTFEENQQIIVDVIGHDSPEIVDKMTLENLRKHDFAVGHKSEARRYVLPLLPGDDVKKVSEGVDLLKSGTGCQAVRRGDSVQVSHRLLCPPAFEMPSVNKRFLGDKYRFFYATGLYDTSQYQYSVVKVDVIDGSVKKWFAGEGQVPSEPQFVERPDARDEDDGVLLVCVTASQATDADRLVVLDASSLEPVAEASLPCHLPITLHGVFLDPESS